MTRKLLINFIPKALRVSELRRAFLVLLSFVVSMTFTPVSYSQSVTASAEALLSPEDTKESLRLLQFLNTATSQSSSKNAYTELDHTYRAPDGEMVKVEVIYAHSESEIDRAFSSLRDSMPNLPKQNFTFEHVVNSDNANEVQLKAKLQGKWKNYGYGGFTAIEQSAAVKKSIKQSYKEFKHSDVAMGILRHEDTSLAILRLVGYSTVTVMSMSVLGDMPFYPALLAGTVAGGIGFFLTKHAREFNRWFTFSGAKTFSEKNIQKDKAGNEVLNSHAEVIVKWEAIQIFALVAMESAKLAFAYTIYSEMIGADYMRNGWQIIFIAATAYLQQGKWEEYIALYFERKQRELKEKFHREFKNKSQRGSEVYQNFKREVSFSNFEARSIGLMLGFVSIGFTSYAMGGSDYLKTAMIMASFGLPAFYFINKERRLLKKSGSASLSDIVSSKSDIKYSYNVKADGTIENKKFTFDSNDISEIQNMIESFADPVEKKARSDYRLMERLRDVLQSYMIVGATRPNVCASVFR